MQDQARDVTVVHADSCTSFQVRCPKTGTARVLGDLPWTLVPLALLVLLACAGGAGLSACNNGEAEARAEARDLLTRLNALEDETSLEKRKQQLDALELLSLKASDDRAARESCYAAHHGLWQAEVEQATAQQALDAAQKQAAPGPGPVAPANAGERGKAASEAIERSNKALADAQKHFPACEQAMQGLIARAR
jgi:hypothetical protein